MVRLGNIEEPSVSVYRIKVDVINRIANQYSLVIGVFNVCIGKHTLDLAPGTLKISFIASFIRAAIRVETHVDRFLVSLSPGNTNDKDSHVFFSQWLDVRIVQQIYANGISITQPRPKVFGQLINVFIS